MKVRAGLVAVTWLAMLATNGCRQDHSGPENTTDSALTADEGEIKGTLTQLGGPGSSAQPVQGKVDVYTLGGNQVSDVSPVSAFNFELKPGTYRLQATVNRVACEPAVVKVVKGTIQYAYIGCPTS